MLSPESSLTLKQLNLLFVDDNIQVSAEAHTLFSSIFKSVSLAHSVSAAKTLLSAQHFDLLITDIELPDKNGLTLVEDIRQTNSDFPIIVLTAHSDSELLLRAANLRLDSYIVKPLTFDKLLPSLNQIAARLSHQKGSHLLHPAVSFNAERGQLTVDDKPVLLGKKEEMLLRLFIANGQRLVSKEMIANRIWPNGTMTESSLKNLLSALRKKLHYSLIVTAPSKGWLLNTTPSH